MDHSRAAKKTLREESLRIRRLSLVAAAALALGAPVHAAEIKVLSTNAFKSALEDLGPKFEQASGHKLAITWGTAANLKREIEQGASADIAVLSDAGADDLIKQGKLAARTPLVRSGIAVAIQKGAPKPALATADDFKKMVLAAKSIAWVETGASGSRGAIADQTSAPAARRAAAAIANRL